MRRSPQRPIICLPCVTDSQTREGRGGLAARRLRQGTKTVTHLCTSSSAQVRRSRVLIRPHRQFVFLFLGLSDWLENISKTHLPFLPIFDRARPRGRRTWARNFFNSGANMLQKNKKRRKKKHRSAKALSNTWAAGCFHARCWVGGKEKYRKNWREKNAETALDRMQTNKGL